MIEKVIYKKNHKSGENVMAKVTESDMELRR